MICPTTLFTPPAEARASAGAPADMKKPGACPGFGKVGKPMNAAAGPTVEQAPTQRLTVEDVVAGLRQDLRLGQG
jgi:hypothetical protein